VQVYADGFDAPPLDQKRLVWHLYEVALAGRDIYYDQRYCHALEMRDVLEAILAAVRPSAGCRPMSSPRFVAIRSSSGSTRATSQPDGPQVRAQVFARCVPAAAHAVARAGAVFPTAGTRH
jgi:dipeptidyl-peptidase-3